ncbi:MAG: C40 family peptidase [Gemmatimonadaceae bacterium]
MRRVGTLATLVFCLSLVLSDELSAQRSKTSRRKPFAALNESAQRLKDSLATRLAPASPTPAIDSFAVSEMVATVAALGDSMLRDSLIAVARSQLGTRYRLGAQAPGRAFDCSGLIKYVMGMLRLDVPRTANEQSKLGREVARDTAALRPGDLLTFGTSKRITHIGIYAGNGRVIHASTTRRQVIETSMENLGPSLLRKWQSARRLIAVAEPSTTELLDQ